MNPLVLLGLGGAVALGIWAATRKGEAAGAAPSDAAPPPTDGGVVVNGGGGFTPAPAGAGTSAPDLVPNLLMPTWGGGGGGGTAPAPAGAGAGAGFTWGGGGSAAPPAAPSAPQGMTPAQRQAYDMLLTGAQTELDARNRYAAEIDVLATDAAGKATSSRLRLGRMITAAKNALLDGTICALQLFNVRASLWTSSESSYTGGDPPVTVAKPAALATGTYAIERQRFDLGRAIFISLRVKFEEKKATVNQNDSELSTLYGQIAQIVLTAKAKRDLAVAAWQQHVTAMRAAFAMVGDPQASTYGERDGNPTHQTQYDLIVMRNAYVIETRLRADRLRRTVRDTAEALRLGEGAIEAIRLTWGSMSTRRVSTTELRDTRSALTPRKQAIEDGLRAQQTKVDTAQAWYDTALPSAQPAAGSSGSAPSPGTGFTSKSSVQGQRAASTRAMPSLLGLGQHPWPARARATQGVQVAIVPTGSVRYPTWPGSRPAGAVRPDNMPYARRRQLGDPIMVVETAGLAGLAGLCACGTPGCGGGCFGGGCGCG